MVAYGVDVCVQLVESELVLGLAGEKTTKAKVRRMEEALLLVHR